MGPVYINYLASVVFASITFIFFFQYFSAFHDRIPVLFVIGGVGCAWAGAYCGANYYVDGSRVWGTFGLTFTALAVVIMLILFILAIRTALNA